MIYLLTGNEVKFAKENSNLRSPWNFEHIGEGEMRSSKKITKLVKKKYLQYTIKTFVSEIFKKSNQTKFDKTVTKFQDLRNLDQNCIFSIKFHFIKFRCQKFVHDRYIQIISSCFDRLGEFNSREFVICSKLQEIDSNQFKN